MCRGAKNAFYLWPFIFSPNLISYRSLLAFYVRENFANKKPISVFFEVANGHFQEDFAAKLSRIAMFELATRR
jgi:hypothetical protein